MVSCRGAVRKGSRRRALPDGPRSLDRDAGEVDVPAELGVHHSSLDAGAVDEGELLAHQRDDTAVLADLLVDVAPGLLTGVSVRDQVGGIDRLVDGVVVVPAVV